MNEFKRNLFMRSGFPSNNSITFRDYCEKWMTTKQINKLKPSSYDRKICTLENQVYPTIGDIPIELLSHDHVQTMVNEFRDYGLSYSTIKKAFGVISECMRDYRIQTKSNNNPTEGIVLPENKKKLTGNVNFFDEKSRKRILEAANAKYPNGNQIYRLGALIKLLMYTGMRIGELQALTWDDVDFDDKTISITKNAVLVRDRSDGAKNKYKLVNQDSTKTGSGRTIPIASIALDALKDLQSVTGDTKYVISTKNGNQVSLRNIQRMFAQILDRAGIEHPCKSTKDDEKTTETKSAGVLYLRFLR